MGEFYTTTFLYAHPSASEGVARLFDFGNTLSTYNASESEYEADEIALALDYRAVARDLNRVIQERAHGTRQEKS